MLDVTLVQMEEARVRLIAKFHSLREVLWSDSISLNEKSRLFVSVSDELYRDANLAYPNLSSGFKMGVRPVGAPPHQCSEEALKFVVERLNQILEYRQYAAEFRVLADKAREIYDSDDTHENKKAALGLLIDPLLIVARGVGKYRQIVNCSYDGFHHRGMENWVTAIEAASRLV